MRVREWCNTEVMEKSKVVSRYVGSMGCVAVTHVGLSLLLWIRRDAIVHTIQEAHRWVPGFALLPSRDTETWWRLAGLYLFVQGLGFGLAAAFSRRPAYRLLCFASALAAAGALAWVFATSGRYLPVLLGLIWQGALALWMVWLLGLELWHRPFADSVPQK